VPRQTDQVADWGRQLTNCQFSIMKKKIKTAEVITKITSVLERSRGTLSYDEIQALEKTIYVLQRFEDSEETEFHSLAEDLAHLGLNLLAKPELMETLIECFKQICN